MKHTKKLTSLLLALVMLFAMTATALASQSGGYYGVTIPEDGILAGHTFTAYQVFKAREEDGVLSDVDWGNGINGPAFLAALKAADPAVFNSCSTAADVAKALDDCADDNALAQQVARIAKTRPAMEPLCSKVQLHYRVPATISSLIPQPMLVKVVHIMPLSFKLLVISQLMLRLMLPQ